MRKRFSVLLAILPLLFSCSSNNISYSEAKEKYEGFTIKNDCFEACLTYKFEINKITDNFTYYAYYNLDFNSDNYYYYSNVIENGVSSQTLIYKLDDGNYYTYFTGLVSQDSFSILDLLNTAKNTIKYYALKEIEFNDETTNSYSYKDNVLTLNIGENIYNLNENGLITYLKENEETYLECSFVYNSSINKRTSI